MNEDQMLLDELKHLKKLSKPDLLQSPLVRCLPERILSTFESRRSSEIIEDVLDFYKLKKPPLNETLYNNTFEALPVSDVVKNLEHFRKFTSRSCVPENGWGTYPAINVCAFLYLQKHAKDIGLPKFILSSVSGNVHERSISDHLYDCFLLSHVNNILHGSFLPIIVVFSMNVSGSKESCAHMVNIIYLPRDNTFHKLFIDSSNITETKDSCRDVNRKYERSERLALERLKDKQENDRLSFKEILCSHNLQKEYGTCGTWSFALTILFLKRWEMIVDGDHAMDVSDWCHRLARKLDREPKTMDKFMDVIFDLKTLINSYIYDMCIKKKKWEPILESISSTNNVKVKRISRALIKLVDLQMNNIYPLFPTKRDHKEHQEVIVLEDE